MVNQYKQFMLQNVYLTNTNTITATMCRSNLKNEVINHATNVGERYGTPKRSDTVIKLNQYP